MFNVVSGLLTRPRSHRRADDTYLVGRRAGCRDLLGHWELPGGKLEPGETDADGLCREWLEEVGAGVRVGPHVLFTYRHGEPPIFELRMYEVDVMDPSWEPPASGESHDMFRWMTAHALLAEPAVTPSTRPFMRELLRRAALSG